MNGGDDRLAAWRSWCAHLAKASAKIQRSTSSNISALPLRDDVRAVAREYMNVARPHLVRAGLKTDVETLDEHFNRLYELSERVNRTSSYKACVAAIRKVIPKITPRLEMQAATGGPSDPEPVNPVEGRMIETLGDLIPTAARSYQQAIKDLTDADRLSFRGTASELREALREVLDHLAPDEAVMKAKGFQLELKRSTPTMKQKVRFILRARKEPTRSTETARNRSRNGRRHHRQPRRSTYDTGSVASHSGERRTVVQLKRYVEAVLSHLLSFDRRDMSYKKLWGLRLRRCVGMLLLFFGATEGVVGNEIDRFQLGMSFSKVKALAAEKGYAFSNPMKSSSRWLSYVLMKDGPSLSFCDDTLSAVSPSALATCTK